MEANGISNQELASMCNISAMTISRLLTKNDYNPTTDTIETIANALGVHEQYIYEAETDAKSKIPLNGYIEFNGAISRIKTFNQLEKVYNDIKHDLDTPKLAESLLDQDKANKLTQSQQPIDITAIDLSKQEEYDTSKLYTWSFRKSDDEKEEMMNDLGNMCQGYPFKVCGEQFLNSECAYISGLFSQNTPKAIEIQRELQASDNGYEAKKSIRRKYEQVGFSRTDWNTFNVQWMLNVVWQKVSQNNAFAKKLRKIPSYAMIVENSTFQNSETATFWGMKNQAIKDAVPILETAAEVKSFTSKKKNVNEAKMKARNSVNHIGTWEGVNCMGKILTICKHCLENGTEPPIDYDLLRSKQIYLFGNLLTFDDEAVKHLPKKRAKYKTIIFDFDGTLLDTRNLRQYVRLFKDPPRGSDAWKQGRKEYISHVKDCEKWDGMDDVIEFIRQNKIPTAIVTANTKDRVLEAIKVFGWKDVFDKKRVFGCYSLGKDMTTKDGDNPALFQKAIDEMGIPASECISLGNEVSDYNAASSIGIEAYNCAWGAKDDDKETMLKDMSDVTLKQPIEIINILKTNK